MSNKARQFDLDKVRIASPCTMSWNEMKGDDRTRHCGACKLNVYNVAGLTKVEALELLTKSAAGERVCMRLMRRKDGTIITKDCPVGVSLARRAKLRLASLSASAVALALWFTSIKSQAQELEPEQTFVASRPEIMGKVAMPPEHFEMMGGITAHPDESMIMGEVAAPPQPEPVEMGEVAPEPWNVPYDESNEE
ncbi:MAG: hypothetical protein AAB250_17405 [Bdellovibrionota bacterium]